MKTLRIDTLILIGLSCFLLALALTVDYHQAVGYMFGDEAVYYMMAQSLVFDLDLEYTHKDIVRIYEGGWQAGPVGVFLSKQEDGRIFYAKSFAYSLLLAPFVLVFGFNGFLVLNTLLLLLMIIMGRQYLQQFNSRTAAFMVATTFFLLSASFVYTFWLTPETFNMFCITLGLFLWLYQRDTAVIRHETTWSFRHFSLRSFSRWLFMTPQGRLYLAPIPIAIACASKLPNLLFIAPILGDIALQGILTTRSGTAFSFRKHSPFWRYARTFLLVALIFFFIVSLFYMLQYVFTRHVNPYAGDRRSFYKDFPGAAPTEVWERGVRLSNEDYAEQSFYFNPKVFLLNIYYYLFGRFTGVLPYFFCALMALYYYLRYLVRIDTAPNRTLIVLRRGLLLLIILASIGGYIFMAPSNYQGGGGAFGNRFFINIYPACLFLITTLSSLRPLLVSWVVGSLFLAQSVLTPFKTSVYPAPHAFRFPYQFLPIEYTLINTLPTLVNPRFVRVDPPWVPNITHKLYFFDDNTDDRTAHEFLVKGERTAEAALRTPVPYPYLIVEVTNGPIGNRVDLTISGESRTITFTQPLEKKRLIFHLDDYIPYFNSCVFPITVRSQSGYVSKFTAGTGLVDPRYIGCHVRLTVKPDPVKLSEVFLENGEPERIPELLEPFLQDHPGHLQARYYLGAAHLQLGHPKRAREHLEHARAALPHYPTAVLQQEREALDRWQRDQERAQALARERGTSVQRVAPQTDQSAGASLVSDDSKEATSHRPEIQIPQGAESHLTDLLLPLTRRYEAEDFAHIVGKIIKNEHISQARGVRFDQMKEDGGFLVFEQNALTMPGRYQVRFRMQISPPESRLFVGTQVAARLDVYNQEHGILAQQEVHIDENSTAASQEYRDYTLNFEMHDPMFLEFRVATSGYAQVAVDYVDVYPEFPLRLYLALARTYGQLGQWDLAEQFLDQLLEVDSYNQAAQLERQRSLIRQGKWQRAMESILQYSGYSPSHTGIATLLLEEVQTCEEADSQTCHVPETVRQFAETLAARFVPETPFTHYFGDQLELAGYHLDVEQAIPGDPVGITYYWTCLRPMDDNYTATVSFIRQGAWLATSETFIKLKQHFGSPNYHVFRHHHPTLYGAYPTSQWLPGERVRAEYEMSIPSTLPADTYEIWLDVRNPLTGKGLTHTGSTKVKLKEIEICPSHDGHGTGDNE